MIFAFLLSVAFLPGISGVGTSPRWIVAALTLPLLIKAPIKFTAAHALGLLFIWYAAVSLTWSANIYDGLDALFKLLLIATAFTYGSQLTTLRPVVIGFGLGITVSSLVILTGLDVPHVSENAGLFVNSNTMGEIAGLVLVAAVAERLWWLIPGIMPAFVLAQCRGAFVAVAVTGFFWIWKKSPWLGFCVGMFGIVFVGEVGIGSTGSIHDRLTMWGDVLPGLSLLGHGLGSFYTLFPVYASFDTLIQRPEHLHNDWLEYLFELGPLCFGLLAVFGWKISRGCGQAERAILLTAAIESCFGFPLHMPATAILGGLVAGYAVRDWPSLQRLLDDRRTRIRGWRWAS